MTDLPIHCTIVGGGIAGLTAALTLQSQDIPVSVVDKGQGIGGRLASRRLRWDGDPQVLGVADYGALQFCVTDPRFQMQVDRWVEQGLLRLVPAPDTSVMSGVASGLRAGAIDTGIYTGTASLRSFTQAISQGLSLHLKTRVTQLHWQETAQRWELIATTGETGGGTEPLPLNPTHLILTCPIPQTLDLLQASAIDLPPDQQHLLQRVRYQPCLTALLLLAAPSQIPAPGLRAKQSLNQTINQSINLPLELQALHCHYHSGISPQGYAVTLQATPAFSEQYWDAEDAWILEKLITFAQPWLGSSVLTQTLHRWRYSQPAQCYPCSDRPHVTLHPHLILAGDAFASQPEPDPNLLVQQAFLSGLSAAEAVLGG